MSYKLVSFLIIFVLTVSHYSNAHTYHSGECPSVEPMSGFEMKQVRKSEFWIYRFRCVFQNKLNLNRAKCSHIESLSSKLVFEILRKKEKLIINLLFTCDVDYHWMKSLTFRRFINIWENCSQTFVVNMFRTYSYTRLQTVNIHW